MDSASLFHQMRIMGIADADLVKMLKIICDEVSRSIGPPVSIGWAKYVTAASNPERFAKKVTAAGFELVATDPEQKDSDDAAVNRFIIETNPRSICALVIVTTDLLDYVQSLQRKKHQNIAIFVAAITLPDDDGRPPLSTRSQNVIKNNEYGFINLACYKNELLLTPWEDKREESAKQLIEPIEYPVQHVAITVALAPENGDNVSFDMVNALGGFVKRQGISVWNVSADSSCVAISLEMPKGKTACLGLYMTMAKFFAHYGVMSYQITAGKRI